MLVYAVQDNNLIGIVDVLRQTLQLCYISTNQVCYVLAALA